MSDAGAFELTLFALAYRLRVDIDVVKSWPYRKINRWLAFFEAREQITERDRAGQRS